MRRTYQSRRRKGGPKKLKQSQEKQSSLTDAYIDDTNSNGSHQSHNVGDCNHYIIKNDEDSPRLTRRYYRRQRPKSPIKRLSTTLNDKSVHKRSTTKQTNSTAKCNYNLRSKHRVTAKITRNTNSDSEDESDKENDINGIKTCRHRVTIHTESVDSTTSFLSTLSLQNNHNHEKMAALTTNDQLTLDDICNDEVDINEQFYDPESMPNDENIEDDMDVTDEWPSWVPRHMIQKTKQNNTDSPSRKRKRNENGQCLKVISPPSKKLKSPNDDQKNRRKSRVNHDDNKTNFPKPVFSTIRKNKRRARRRSSLDYVQSDVETSGDEFSHNRVTPANNIRRANKRDHVDHGCRQSMSFYADMETPIGSIRTQRIHRLTRKSNTDLLMDVLLKNDNGKCQQLNQLKEEIKQKNSRLKITKTMRKQKKLTFEELNGLQSVGKMDTFLEKLCLSLLDLGADPLTLNSDGISAIYVAMHYKNNYAVIAKMIENSILSNYEELNQTYIFASHGTLSLMDIALRIGEVKTIKLLLENDLMPTKHSIDEEPKVELMTFCKQHRMSKLANRILKEQLFEAVDNLDIEYIEAIVCHGIDVNIKIEKDKSSLYYLVQQQFDIYDEIDAKDQFETIQCLLRYGANPNFVDLSKTPMIIYPLQRSGQWNIKLVDILLYNGANLRCKVGATSKTVYMYAKQNCVCDEILKIITNYHNTKYHANKNKKNDNEKHIELDVTTNDSLTSIIKTRNVVTKSYKRNRRVAK